MPETLIAKCLTAARGRGSEYAVLYYKPKDDLEFVEAYDDFEELRRAKKWWRKMGYRPAGTWPLDFYGETE